MVGCLCLPNACLYNGNYLLCYDRQVNNMRKTSWIWCWALYISPLRALTAVSSEAEGILCTPDYSQKNIVGVWPNLTVNSWSLLQLSFRKTDISLGISVIQTVTMHSSAPAPHSVTYLQPERKSLDLYSLQMKCLGKVPPSVVLPYVKSLHCHLAAVFSSGPNEYPGQLQFCEPGCTALWLTGNLKAFFQMWLGGPSGQASTVTVLPLQQNWLIFIYAAHIQSAAVLWAHGERHSSHWGLRVMFSLKLCSSPVTSSV